MRPVGGVFLVCTVVLTAQQQPATVPSYCSPHIYSGRFVRAGGKAELTADLFFSCHGGKPVPTYAPVPTYTIQVEMAYAKNSEIYTSHYVRGGGLNVASRQLGLDGYLETLLIVDEPRSAAHPETPLTLCNYASPFSLYGVCPIIGNGSGTNQYDGSAGHPNVYQGRLVKPGVVEWTNIPIDFGPDGSSPIFRVTNLRVDTTPIPPVRLFDTPRKIAALPHVISASGEPIPIIGFPQPIWNLPGEEVGTVLAAAYAQVSDLVTLDQCHGNNIGMLTDSTQPAEPTFNVSVVEGTALGYPVPGAFRRKNWATGGFDTNQNVVGFEYTGSESGFENLGPAFDPPSVPGTPPPSTPAAAFPLAQGLSKAGVADQGTRFALQFASVPEGVALFAPAQLTLTSQTNGGITGSIMLVLTDSLGAGPFAPVSVMGLWAPVGLTKGSGMVVYEVVSNDPKTASQFTVPVAVANAPEAPVAGVQATVNVVMAPWDNSSVP